MARGWESKSVEDQMASAKEGRAPLRPTLTTADRERLARRDSLRLSRSKTLADLAKARDDRHRAMLQRSLDFLDNELAKEDE